MIDRQIVHFEQFLVPLRLEHASSSGGGADETSSSDSE